MPVSWCNGWRQVSDERRRLYIEGELRWELNHVSEHPLRSVPFRVVGAFNLYDDFIVLLKNGSYGYVHLVWKPATPGFKLLGNEEAVQRFISEWKSNSEPAT